MRDIPLKRVFHGLNRCKFIVHVNFNFASNNRSHAGSCASRFDSMPLKFSTGIQVVQNVLCNLYLSNAAMYGTMLILL